MASNLLLTPEIRQSYRRKLLERFRTTTVFNRFGDQEGIEKNNGVNLSWRRMEIIRPVVTASTVSWPADATYTSAVGALLTEGTFHVPAVEASWAQVTATVRQYGQAAYISEWNDAQAIDPQVPEYVANFGEAMPELLDLVTRDVLLLATTIQYANARAERSLVISGDFLTLVEFRKALRTLKRNNARPVEDGMFVGLIHPDCMYDLQGDTNITNVWVTGGGLGKESDYFKPQFKDIPFGVRLYESSIVPITRFSGYGDIYNTWVFGKGFYGTTKVNAIPAEVIVHAPGTSGVADPLNQVGTVGWKANWAAALLDNNQGVIIRSQASAFTGTRAGGPV